MIHEEGCEKRGSYQLHITPQQPGSGKNPNPATVAILETRAGRWFGCESDPNTGGSSNERKRADNSDRERAKEISSKEMDGP